MMFEFLRIPMLAESILEIVSAVGVVYLFVGCMAFVVRKRQ